MSHRIISGHRVSYLPLLVAIILLPSPLSVLDPCISYQGILEDHSDDISCQSHVELTKEHLKYHYCEQYIPQAPIPITAPQPLTPQLSSHLPQKVNFTAWYKQKCHTEINQLEEFWKLPQEYFENNYPVQWWASQWAQFTRLSQFARDIFTIAGELAIIVSSNLLNSFLKGSAVAVEKILSGGHDTISLHCASLQLETIRTLMLVTAVSGT